MGRLEEGFFSLCIRVVGEIMQKFVDHRLRLAVIGDLSRHLEAGAALRALVRESDRSGHVWFLPDWRPWTPVSPNAPGCERSGSADGGPRVRLRVAFPREPGIETRAGIPPVGRETAEGPF